MSGRGRKMADKTEKKQKRMKVEHIMSKYGVGVCTSLMKEKMADNKKSGICFE
jgi:hypothetical protein